MDRTIEPDHVHLATDAPQGGDRGQHVARDVLPHTPRPIAHPHEKPPARTTLRGAADADAGWSMPWG